MYAIIRSMTKPRLVLIDGSAVFHRGYHAIPHLSNKDGLPTNAIYGFTTILLKVLGDLKPEYVIVAWDKSSQTFRNEMYPEYKATRKKQPDDLYQQIPYTKELVEAMGIPLIEVDNYEADDIIGTLARKAEARGDLEIVIATGDRDQLQLVDRATVVDMFNPRGMEPTRYDVAKMQEKYGLTPQQFIDYKALVGDASDNIPGVAGIGDIGARKLLTSYKTLDGIYEHLDDITGKQREYLDKGREMAYLSRKLSTIVCDMDLELNLDQARLNNSDRDKVHELFRKFDFKSLLSKLPAPKVEAGGDLTLFGDSSAGTVEKSRKHLENISYISVTTNEMLADLVKQLAVQPIFAFDTETDTLDMQAVNLVGISVCFEEGKAYYIPIGHKEGVQLTPEFVIQQIKPIFENPQIKKTGHNIKFDYEVLAKYGIRVQGIAFDTMVAAFILNPLGRTQSLDDLVYREFGFEMIPITDLIGAKGKNQGSFDQTLIEKATLYAGEDADMSWRLYCLMEPRIRAEGFERLTTQTEWPLIPVLGDMELAGITLDTGVLAAFNKTISKRIMELQEEIWKLAGTSFNLGSPSQLAGILFTTLGISPAGIKKGKTGYSTAADELEKIRDKHPIVSLISEYRELDKLKNTYVDALPLLVKPDGRIHTSFNQTIAATGRLSSTNPNLQNIPVRTELGREIRKAFVAPAGRRLVSADYSQIELRVAAALSGDGAMIKTFQDGIDLHQQTAAELFNVPLEKVSKDQRYAAKTINFGVLYGMSAHGLSVATGMGREEATGFIQRYFEVRPKLAEYIKETKAFAHEHEYTQTLFGRKRPCPEINSNNFMMSAGAERMAVNVPIQGTAADIYKLAMIAVAAKLDDDTQLLLQIHDELIAETSAEKVEKVAALMREAMENVYDLGVPLAVDTAIGESWGDL